MKIKSVLVRSAGVVSFSIIGIGFIGINSLAYAQSSSTIAQSFKTNATQDIVNGALVSTQGNKNIIELATSKTANRLVGVVDSSPLVSLSGNDQEVEIVLSGATEVLVSDINGTIKSGDKIAASPVAGVGMKATTDGQVVGTAQNTFQSTATRTIMDRDGKAHTIRLGSVRTQIGIATYQATGSNFLPPFIQSTANSIAGRPVSLMRVLICSILLMLGFVTVIILVYTATRSAMTSLGRNPLAAHAIRRGLYQTITIALIIVSCTLLGSYLILTV